MRNTKFRASSDVESYNTPGYKMSIFLMVIKEPEGTFNNKKKLHEAVSSKFWFCICLSFVVGSKAG